MLYILLLMGNALLAVTLHRVLAQMKAWADTLQIASPDSNLRLDVSVRLPGALALCRAINDRLDAAQQQTLEARAAGKQLQYAIAAVSHDIRTPLTGAAGYLELMAEEGAPQAREQYLAVIRRRLKDLEQLLDELFLYTRLTGPDETQPLPCEKTALYPALCDALAALYPKLQAAGVEPEVETEDEHRLCRANGEALGRILRNLILNAAQHGAGDLKVRQSGRRIAFSNTVKNPDAIDTERLFDRFWRADAARSAAQGGAGLGLAIVRQLAERMGAQVCAELKGDTLTITLTLAE